MSLRPGPTLPRLHAYGVCDDSAYFYHYIDGLIQGVVGGVRAEADVPLSSPQPPAQSRGLLPLHPLVRAEAVVPPAHDLLRLIQAKGSGYAISTQEELQTIKVGPPIWVGSEAAAAGAADHQGGQQSAAAPDGNRSCCAVSERVVVSAPSGAATRLLCATSCLPCLLQTPRLHECMHAYMHRRLPQRQVYSLFHSRYLRRVLQAAQ